MEMQFDDALLQTSGSLASILLNLAMAGGVLGVLTLPIFHLVLWTVRGWFWGRDELSSVRVEGERRSFLRKPFAFVLAIGVPLGSLAICLFLLGYFGLFNASDPSIKVEDRASTQFKNRWNEVTRAIAIPVTKTIGSIIPLVSPPLKGDAIPGIGSFVSLEKAPPAPDFDPSKGPPPGAPKDGAPKKEGPPPLFDAQNGPYPGGAPPIPEFVKFEIRLGIFTTVVRALMMILLLAFGPFPLLVVLITQLFGRNHVTLVMRSITRNALRTSLSYLATFVLAFVICAVFSILVFINAATEEKAANLKVIVTEKNQIPSQMPPKFKDDIVRLIEEMGKTNPNVRLANGDADLMTWSFVGGTTDPKNRSFTNSLFFFCMEPRKVLTMLDGLDELTSEENDLLQKGIDIMEKNPQGIVLGMQRMRMMGKRVGDRIKLTSLNYKDLIFDMEIVGNFPEGTRYDQSAVMNRSYLDKALEEYEGKSGKHPLADKCLNLIWLRMPTRDGFEALAAEVNKPGRFSPAIKMETASSGISSWLDSAKDMLWAMQWLLCPALLIVMALVISNAISISVRERRTEMAVLKVLGFQPWMIMIFVLGEALLIGMLSGFMACATAFAIVNAIGGVPFPIAFFPKFLVPASAMWWGPVLGGTTAFLGSFLPALSARKVKVSEVFAKVA